EDVARGDIRHEHRLYAPHHAGQGAGQRKGRHLVPEGGHAHYLGYVFVVVNGEQAKAEAGVVDDERDNDGGHGGGQRQQIKGSGRRRAELGHGHGAKIHALPAVDGRIEHDGGHHKGGGQRKQREELAPHRLDPERHHAQHGAEQRGKQARQRKRPQEGHVELAGKRSRGVHAYAVERAMAKRKIARVARQYVPGSGQRHPMEDQVQHRCVQGRQAQRGHDGQPDPGQQNDKRGAAHDQALPGRTSSTSMSSENDTSGAHEGDATAMVTASETPMMQPAISGPMGRPRPPSMTAANTTPIQVYICDGARVKLSAMHTPAMPASEAFRPESIRASARWLMPKAAAMGASSAAARSALPRSLRLSASQMATEMATLRPSVMSSGKGRNSSPMR